MAGVGFSLRELDRGDSHAGRARAYGAAGLIACGPWLLSISSLLLAGLFGARFGALPGSVVQFQVATTWLFAGSLVIGGPLQLAFTRFVADREYQGENDQIVPNLLGALTCTSAGATALAWCVTAGFAHEGRAVRLLIALGLCLLCDLWLVVGVLTGLREHRKVLVCFGLGYAFGSLATLALARFGLVGLFAGFVLGQAVLLLASLSVLLLAARGPAGRVDVAFRFLRRGQLLPDLALAGLLCNLAVWADNRLLFGVKPATSQVVLGWFRASEVYDLPIFLGYLASVPGMAVYLLRVETDFAVCHRAYYAAVSGGASLRSIDRLAAEMSRAAREGLAALIKVQGLTWLACVWLGRPLLQLFGLSPLHFPLLCVDALGVALQVLLLAATSLLFYLDRRSTVLWLGLLLLGSNVTLTLLSQRLGPAYYGFGFAVAMAVTSLAALAVLGRALSSLVRDTFMMQPVSP
jgi:polysaccharide biosynthesis protein PelG